MDEKERLIRIINSGEELLGKQKTSSDPDFVAWNSDMLFFVENIYGLESERYKRLKKRSYTLQILIGDTPRSKFIERFEKDLEKTLAELKMFLNNFDSDKNFIEIKKNKEISKKQDAFSINISNENINENYNYNENIITVKTFLEIKNEIKNNSYIGDEEKKDLIEKLIELEKIKNSNESKTDKWGKIKTILSFLLDKGADVVIMFLPQIIDILSI